MSVTHVPVWPVSRSSTIAFRAAITLGELVLTTMPSETGVWHDASGSRPEFSEHVWHSVEKIRRTGAL